MQILLLIEVYVRHDESCLDKIFIYCQGFVDKKLCLIKIAICKVRHNGKRSVSVANAGMEKFSGWSRELPAKPGALYAVSAWAKGGNLAAMSQVGGGAICLQFLDAEGQIIGKNIISTTVSAKSDWTSIHIKKYPAPNFMGIK